MERLIRSGVIGAMVLLVVLSLSPARAHHSTDFSRLRNRVANLEDKVATLRAQRLAMNDAIGVLESNVTELQGQVAALQSQMSSAQSSILTLSSQSSSMQTSIGDLNDKTSQLTTLGDYLGDISGTQIEAPFGCSSSEPMQWGGLSGPTCDPISLSSDITGSLDASRISTPFLCSGDPAIWALFTTGLTC